MESKIILRWTDLWLLSVAGVHERVQFDDGADHAPLCDAGAAAVSAVAEPLQPELRAAVGRRAGRRPRLQHAGRLQTHDVRDGVKTVMARLMTRTRHPSPNPTADGKIAIN